MEKKKLEKLAKVLGAEIITDLEKRKRFEKKYGFPLNLENRTVETCGDCKHWDTAGFGFREDWGSQKASLVGTCRLVSRSWYPTSDKKMISLMGTEHARWPGSKLIAVITRREFGCNQFKPFNLEK